MITERYKTNILLIVPLVRNEEVGKIVVSRDLVVVNLPTFFEANTVLTFAVGLSLIFSIFGSNRTFDSTLGSLKGVVNVLLVEVSLGVVASSFGVSEDCLRVVSSVSVGGKGVVDLKLQIRALSKYALCFYSEL